MEAEKKRIKELIDLLGVDIDIDDIPLSACRPILDTLAGELKTIVSDL